MHMQVVTVTSDLRGAGTDANVHLIMHGMLGDGKRHILTSGPDDFDRCAKHLLGSCLPTGPLSFLLQCAVIKYDVYSSIS